MPCCAAQHTHISFAWIMTFSFWRSPTFQSSLGGDRSWQPHIGHSGTMRQAGEQLYYSSGMAGSAEGEALTPILMRLYAAQWPSVCGRIRQKQSHSYHRGYCLMETLHHSEKKLFAFFSFHLNPLNLWNILTNLLHTKHSQHSPDNNHTSILLPQEQQPLLVS